MMADPVECLIDTPVCVIAFAVENHSDDASRYQFARTLNNIKVAHVLARDQGHWYHNGILGVGDLAASVAYVRALKPRYRRLVTLGSSYGAHGALLIGQLAPVDEVIAISPIADVGIWDRQWGTTKAPSLVPGLTYDITPLFPNGPIPKVKAFIGEADDTVLDMPSCRALGISEVTTFPGCPHGDVAVKMRDEGYFSRLLGQ